MDAVHFSGKHIIRGGSFDERRATWSEIVRKEDPLTVVSKSQPSGMQRVALASTSSALDSPGCISRELIFPPIGLNTIAPPIETRGVGLEARSEPGTWYSATGPDYTAYAKDLYDGNLGMPIRNSGDSIKKWFEFYPEGIQTIDLGTPKPTERVLVQSTTVNPVQSSAGSGLKSMAQGLRRLLIGKA
jgi:hypothetical protein